MGPLGTLGTIRDHTGPYGTIWDHMGPYGAILAITGNMGPNGTIPIHTGAYRTILGEIGPYIFQSPLGSSLILGKKVRIIPLHKKDDLLNPKNYRPVAIIPILSKVPERVVFNQMIQYLNKNNLIHSNHHAYR